ncbi:MAG: O-antigen ligase family protein [Bacteroides sp.]|nr:O-antigen ligase family protein [Bacteroides sp.]
MEQEKKQKMLYRFGLWFTVLNIVLMVNGFYWLTAIPVAIAIMLLLFFSLDKLLLFIVLLTPFTFKYEFEHFGITINMPTEPLIVAAMLLFFLRMIHEPVYDRRVLRHPITIVLTLNLVWMFLTSVTSELPLVSFKYFASRLWFVVTFYFLAILLFKDYKKYKRFLWYFGAALALVVIVITVKHSAFGFERMVGTWIVDPFFNDHTNYSSTLALVAPFFLVMAFNKGFSPLRRTGAVLFFLVFCMGILFSYSRAAWLSLMIAAGGLVILGLKIPFRFILAGVILLLATVFTFQTQIIMQLERNTQESSGNFTEHIRSISNISSDASNLERINRWRSAFRMFEERPVVGWGPGTYQFVYAPFQRSEDFTIITTNFGDLGNAHSEYIGPLAESGLPGMLLFLTLALLVIKTGVDLWKKAPTREMRLMALGITLGFITYFSHGVLNNFLDTDKASVPFWGMMAMLVSLDAFYSRENSKNPVTSA